MTNKKIWAATLFSTLLLTMTISSPVKAAELQTSTTVDRSQITLPLSEETEENLFSLESVSDIQMSELVDPDVISFIYAISYCSCCRFVYYTVYL